MPHGATTSGQAKEVVSHSNDVSNPAHQSSNATVVQQQRKKAHATRFSAQTMVLNILVPTVLFLPFFAYFSIMYLRLSPMLRSGQIVFGTSGFVGRSEPVSLTRMTPTTPMETGIALTQKTPTTPMETETASLDLGTLSSSLFTFPAGNAHDLWDSAPFLMTTHFTSREDPQRASSSRSRNSFSYIEKWYRSLQKLGMRGVVFTDSHDLKGLQRLSTDKIIFVKVNIDNYRSRSLNDVRFFVYRDFLRSLKQQPAMVFMTDGSDVEVVRNPFPSFTKDRMLYVGGITPNPMNRNGWMLGQFRKMQRTYQHNSTGIFEYADILEHDTVNAGVIGGETSTVLELLDRMVELFDKFDPSVDINMGVLNIVAWRDFKDRLVHGSPVVSGFKKYEYWRKDVYFRHKR